MRAYIRLSICVFCTLTVLGSAFALHAQQPATSSASQNQNSNSSSPSPTPANAPFGEITGIVKSGSMPLPGVTITAANTLTGKKYVTSTDVDGSYKIEVGG